MIKRYDEKKIKSISGKVIYQIVDVISCSKRAELWIVILFDAFLSQQTMASLFLDHQDIDNDDVCSISNEIIFDHHDLEFEHFDNECLQPLHQNSNVEEQVCPSESADCG